MSENVLLVGATSAIARALAQRLAARGCNLLLASRNNEELESLASDLRIRYQQQVLVETLDALNLETHPAFVERAMGAFHESLQGAVLCQGVLYPQSQAGTNWQMSSEMLQVNLTASVSLLNLLAERFAALGRGYLAGISSVAGDRGRGSNYVYGASKAGLTAYLDGLRNHLHASGVHVLTIKPGPVDTPMLLASGQQPSTLTASPERVARDIERALRRRKNYVYSPWFWRWIMAVIRRIPEPLFKRMKM